MLLDLVIRKLKDLQSIWECSLCGLCFCKVIHNFLIREWLFNVIISKVHNWITVRPYFPLDPICENYLFLSILIEPLYLSIMTYYLILNLQLLSLLSMILTWELQIELFFFLFIFNLLIIMLLYYSCCLLLFL